MNVESHNERGIFLMTTNGVGREKKVNCRTFHRLTSIFILFYLEKSFNRKVRNKALRVSRIGLVWLWKGKLKDGFDSLSFRFDSVGWVCMENKFEITVGITIKQCLTLRISSKSADCVPPSLRVTKHKMKLKRWGNEIIRK